MRPGTRDRYPDHVTAEGPFGTIRAPVSVAERLERPAGVVWIAVKATQLTASLLQIAEPELAGRIVPLLNGVEHVARLRDRLGHDRIVPATISVESERLAPGRVVVRSPFMRLRVAEPAGASVVSAIAALERYGFDCACIADEPTLLWGKLVLLAPIALATTAAEAPIGIVLADAAFHDPLQRCLHEACAVATAFGASVDAHAVLAAIHGLPAGLRSSMQKDRAAGRPLELDAIAGPIIRGGRRHGIATPATEQLVRAAGATAPQPGLQTRRA